MAVEEGKDVSPRQAVAAINRWYDTRMYAPWADNFYDGSDFHNYGYWDSNTRTPKAASENLMEQLLSFIPLKRGTILDVACGKGATTRYLLNYFTPECVTGINISEKQVERSKLNAPACEFLIMDAAELIFEDNYFDHIICVEAAMHFDTREKFLRAAWRVLKPGGHLVLSDVLTQKPIKPSNMTHPAANYVEGRAEYRKLCRRAGFEEITIIDATRECWNQFYTHRMHLFRKELLNKQIDRLTFNRAVNMLSRRNRSVRFYLLVSAQKPIL
jgi:MPBQ/MSBQ methyltransferase